MPPEPFYTPATLRDPAFQLRYGWTGWIANPPAPAVDLALLFKSLDPIWEADDLRRLKHHVVDGTWQITFSAKPPIASSNGKERAAPTPSRPVRQ